MAGNLPDHVLQTIGWYWHGIPSTYRTPIAFTSCAALILTPLAWKKLAYQPQLLPPILKDYEYNFELTKDVSDTLTLPDGRQIGYAQYGDPTGRPIITLHGILGSRLESALLHANAKELGLRIIGLERPGMGLSTSVPAKNRKVIDHARDVEALASHLKLKEYAILGVSGGAPYALGCAASLPSSPSAPQSKAISLVTAQGLADMPQTWSPVLLWLNRTLNLRWLLRFIFTSSPAWQMNLSDEQRAEGMRQAFDVRKAHPADLAVAQSASYPDMLRIFLRSSRAAVEHGFDGFLDDADVVAKDPGFEVRNVRFDLPVQIWCGGDDTNVSPLVGPEIKRRLEETGNRSVELNLMPGETHGSTQVKFQRQILEDLVRIL